VNRAIWKGLIHFGTIDVPVRLHNAVKESRMQFHLLHKSDHVRLKQEMVCAFEKIPVPKEEQVRGFEIDDGRYILIKPEELEEIEPEESRTIEVHEFASRDQIDPIFFEHVFYLESDALPKEYNTLVTALSEMDVHAICTWTMRKRSYLGSLWAGGSILCLTTLRYADEVIPAKALDLEEISLSEKELQIGRDLINQMTAPFEPEQYTNEHEKKLHDLIEKKIRGERIEIPLSKDLKATEADNLLETLEASLRKVA
jgi:DNA end-binding protein Ku